MRQVSEVVGSTDMTCLVLLLVLREVALYRDQLNGRMGTITSERPPLKLPVPRKSTQSWKLGKKKAKTQW